MSLTYQNRPVRQRSKPAIGNNRGMTFVGASAGGPRATLRGKQEPGADDAEQRQGPHQPFGFLGFFVRRISLWRRLATPLWRYVTTLRPSANQRTIQHSSTTDIYVSIKGVLAGGGGDSSCR
jgi:hypothetical protein